MDNQKLQCLFKGSFSFSKSSFLVSMLNFQGVDIGSPVELSKRKSPWSCSWCKHLQKQCVVCRNNVGFPKLFMDWTENYLHTKQLRPSWDPKLIALDRTSQQLHCHDFPTKIPGTKAPEKPSKRFAMQTLRWETKRWWTKKHQKTPKECVIFGTLFFGLMIGCFQNNVEFLNNMLPKKYVCWKFQDWKNHRKRKWPQILKRQKRSRPLCLW